MYVLVIVNGNSHRIGLNEYSYQDAKKRQNEMNNLGIDVQVMSFNDAYGLTS